MINLVWFRNNLRIHDNPPLAKAMKNGQCLCLYCFDEEHFGKTGFGFPKTGAIRAKFLIESVSNLRKNLRKMGGELIIRSGKTAEEICKLKQEFGIEAIYAPKEDTSEELAIESEVAKATGLPLLFESIQTLYHPDDIPFKLQSTPDVFTAFRKKIEKECTVRSTVQLPRKFDFTDVPDPGELPDLNDLGLREQDIDPRAVLQFKGGENEALNRVQSYIWDGDHLKNYKFTRNGLTGAGYSSKFSPWLANGSLSPGKIYEEVCRYENERKQNVSTYWMKFELTWRDFFRFSAIRHGNDIFRHEGISGKEFTQSNDMDLFKKWAQGNTGIPFIDANMRELNSTGYMSNRGRQNVASFLSQNLNIDWRMGASWFESRLIDYDVCSNWGNWAYNSAVGHDPRDRYFNIVHQAKKYDKKGEYVRLWLPELKNIPDNYIHEPWKAESKQPDLFDNFSSIDYPQPVIDLDKSYEKIKERSR